MRRILFLLLFCLVGPALRTQTNPPTEWRSGLVEINDDWAEHEGDNLAWAQPSFDSSSWKTVDLEDMGPAQTGWHWFRKRVNVGPDHPEVRLLLEGGVGTYELYVNGVRVTDATINSEFDVYRPVERVYALEDDNGDFTIALRTHAPPNYVAYNFPLFLSVTLGLRTAIEYERASTQSDRLYDLWPSLGINLLLCFAAIGALCLSFGRDGRREYLYLGLYLFVVGLSNGVWNLQLTGVVPTSFNFLGSDPLIFVYTILQIEFTFSFVGKRPGRAMRIYQGILLLPSLLVPLCWMGRFRADTYSLIEAAITLPVAFILTPLLLFWYRKGNREAGWLILPSLLPLVASSLFNIGFASIVMGWRRFDFLDSYIPVGLLRFQPPDVANLLYLAAIAIVMFFRFTRVSREQAHAAAEFDAARLVQERLISAPPEIPGFTIASAYLPAQQVGGDFFRVRADHDEVLIVIGDVSGKGLGAAMTVSAIVGALRALPKLDPGQILAALNRGLTGNMSGGFVTCLALRVTSDGAATIANAGHLSPYRDGKEIALPPGLPLGIADGIQYSEANLQLAPGDTLTMLTDGVVEAQSPAGELFGFDRTAALSGQDANQIAHAAKQFGQEDDITVLSLTYSPAETAK
jgi:phosphoserine phosphatase RsbU/P